MVFYEKLGKKEITWELSSDIGKYDNIYKVSFQLKNDEGAEQGKVLSDHSITVSTSFCFSFEI